MTVNEVVEPVGRVVECLGLAVIALRVAVALAVSAEMSAKASSSASKCSWPATSSEPWP